MIELQSSSSIKGWNRLLKVAALCPTWRWRRSCKVQREYMTQGRLIMFLNWHENIKGLFLTARFLLFHQDVICFVTLFSSLLLFFYQNEKSWLWVSGCSAVFTPCLDSAGPPLFSGSGPWQRSPENCWDLQDNKQRREQKAQPWPRHSFPLMPRQPPSSSQRLNPAAEPHRFNRKHEANDQNPAFTSFTRGKRRLRCP